MENLVFKSQKGNVVTNSRLVAEKFGKRHSDVIRAIEEHIKDLYSTDAKLRWYYESTYCDQKNENRKMYIMNRDGFSLLVMSFSNTRDVLEFKIKFIEAFNKMEAVIKQSLPQTFSEALQLAANQAKQIEEHQKQLTDQEPKVLFADSVAASEKSILISQLAKILKQNGVQIGQNRLFEKLRHENYLLTKGEYYNKPSQKAMELGLFEIKETAINKPDGNILLQTTTKVTGKGQVYFVNKFVNKSLSIKKNLPSYIGIM